MLHGGANECGLLDQIGYSSLLGTGDVLAVDFDDVIAWSEATDRRWTVLGDFAHEGRTIAHHGEPERVIRST